MSVIRAWERLEPYVMGVRKRTNRQTIETLINEEALLFAKYLRNEKETWTPRIAVL